MTTIRKVTFQSNSIPIAADLYLPPSTAPDRHGAAISISHPMTGVKEQTSGLYARKLADAGFVALAFDAAYQGESGGTPRYLESPFQRADDSRAAVSFLMTLTDKVDPNKIGVLGICASGGYICSAAQTDTRMRAVATVSAGCTGRLTREGLLPKGAIISGQLAEALDIAARHRTDEEAKGQEPHVTALLPPIAKDVPDQAPDMIKEAADYYRTSRACHPHAPSLVLTRNAQLLANYDSFRFNDMISPRPLLMIIGSKAETAYFSRDAVALAKEPKELYEIEGKTHIDLYDDLTETLPKLVDFYTANLV